MKITLLRGFLLQAFYPYQPRKSFYYAVCPWYGHHLPELKASGINNKSWKKKISEKKLDGAQVHLQHW